MSSPCPLWLRSFIHRDDPCARKQHEGISFFFPQDVDETLARSARWGSGHSVGGHDDHGRGSVNRECCRHRVDHDCSCHHNDLPHLHNDVGTGDHHQHHDHDDNHSAVARPPSGETCG